MPRRGTGVLPVIAAADFSGFCGLVHCTDVSHIVRLAREYGLPVVGRAWKYAGSPSPPRPGCYKDAGQKPIAFLRTAAHLRARLLGGGAGTLGVPLIVQLLALGDGDFALDPAVLQI